MFGSPRTHIDTSMDTSPSLATPARAPAHARRGLTGRGSRRSHWRPTGGAVTRPSHPHTTPPPEGVIRPW
jgi:hypothetical protein